MSKAKITLYGFYEYFRNRNQDLFSTLALPPGIDKTVFIDSLLMRAGEFEVIYSNPDFTREAIGSWGKKWRRTFEKWIDALSIEYAPLENYDRMETWEEDEDIKDNESTKDTGETNTTSNSNVDTDTENKVSAFDISTYQPESQTTTATDTESTDKMTTEAEGSKTRTSDRKNVKSGRAHGNIGVTTSQQMLQAELDVQYWNIFDRMSDIFIAEFLIPVYE